MKPPLIERKRVRAVLRPEPNRVANQSEVAQATPSRRSLEGDYSAGRAKTLRATNCQRVAELLRQAPTSTCRRSPGRSAASGTDRPWRRNRVRASTSSSRGPRRARTRPLARRTFIWNDVVPPATNCPSATSRTVGVQPALGPSGAGGGFCAAAREAALSRATSATAAVRNIARSSVGREAVATLGRAKWAVWPIEAGWARCAQPRAGGRRRRQRGRRPAAPFRYLSSTVAPASSSCALT
jgi:hypothetical protein